MGQRDQVLRVLAKDLRRYMEKLDIDYRLLQENTPSGQMRRLWWYIMEKNILSAAAAV